jgi:hypothetical protein
LSVYFREPRGVLFELATPSPGFAVDEDPAHFGAELRRPPQYEDLRERLERSLTPLHNPRAGIARVMTADIDLIEDQLGPSRGEPAGVLVLLHDDSIEPFARSGSAVVR